SWRNVSGASERQHSVSPPNGEGTTGEGGVNLPPGVRQELRRHHLASRSRRLSARRATRCWEFPPRPGFPENTRAENAGRVEIQLPLPLPQWGSNARCFLSPSERGKSNGNIPDWSEQR